jgi:hypothetical protein
VLVTDTKDLIQLVNSESRVMLLYSTREEAIHILNAARDYKITGENYVWVVTQSVMENLQTPFAFPVGMLGTYIQGDPCEFSSESLCLFSPLHIQSGCSIPSNFLFYAVP